MAAAKQIEVIKGKRWNRNAFYFIVLLLILLLFLTSAAGKKVVPSIVAALSSMNYDEASKWYMDQLDKIGAVFFFILGVSLVFVAYACFAIPFVGWVLGATLMVVAAGLIWESTKQLMKWGVYSNSGLDGARVGGDGLF